MLDGQNIFLELLTVLTELLTCHSLFGTKIAANTSTLHWETYLYHSLCKISHFDPLTNHKRCKTSRVRDKGHCTKNGGFRASSVVQLHYVPFQLQITTADQLVLFVLPWVNFVLPWVNFVLPWVNFVLPWVNSILPWINGVLPWVHFVLPSHNIVLPWVQFIVPWLFVLPWQLWATVGL